ncbi:hypothetical protein MZD04_gp149 [Pseudomonas phage Psa21]|uniref:Uncharacterized protein n=1 Tax=Pseudomonas phage Psa21 TaxID=2530023 RepID=A0A481W4J4_9CAUD|nr:hypothetical protein MZD04_gp149 [Pseudomonas phage Psa21]QBJ02676.1 hypothetical protein PSA21_149 [Pseudomonas phage Psa21]
MRSLIRTVVATTLPGSNWGQRILADRQAVKEAAEMNLAADTIERMLCKGYYEDSAFMCISLKLAAHQGKISEKGMKAAVKEIEGFLGKHKTLSCYLHHIRSPLIELYVRKDASSYRIEDEAFGYRIAHSNWFWGFINQLRMQAKLRNRFQW